MSFERPRGIAVADVGYTNTKIMLFSPDLAPVAERKIASRHREGPPYRNIDPEPMAALCREALPVLDRILPVDAVVPCAHGAALACLAADGSLAMPVMDYTSEPPPDIVADYRGIAPGFEETFCTLLPMALTHGLQLYWQKRAWPADFARIATVIPWIQYVGFRLSGKAVTEMSSMSCQTHLMDTRSQTLSSLVRRQGWEALFPPMAKAWETIGRLRPEFTGPGFRGRGAGLREQDRELVPTEPGHHVGGPYGIPHPLRHDAEEPVSRGVAPQVVDGLEIVEVDVREREVSSVAHHPENLGGKQLDELPTVHRAGEDVPPGELLLAPQEIADDRLHGHDVGHDHEDAEPHEDVPVVEMVRIRSPCRMGTRQEQEQGRENGDRDPGDQPLEPGDHTDRDQVEKDQRDPGARGVVQSADQEDGDGGGHDDEKPAARRGVSEGRGPAVQPSFRGSPGTRSTRNAGGA